MSFRSLPLTAAAGVVLFVLLDWFLFRTLDERSRFIWNAAARTTLLAFVAFAASLAASRFGWWSEYVGRAWTLFFTAYSLLALGELLRRTISPDYVLTQVALIGANIALVAAYIVTARSFRAAGLDFGASGTRTWTATVLAFAIALALCLDPIVGAWQELGQGIGRPSALVSPIADVITFALVAPLLLSAFALRGGKQFWVYALLTTGTIGWMINQGIAGILQFLGVTEASTIRSGRVFGFAMACFFIAAAAIAQWLAAKSTTGTVADV
jgi:hypothetical protein